MLSQLFFCANKRHQVACYSLIFMLVFSGCALQHTNKKTSDQPSTSIYLSSIEIQRTDNNPKTVYFYNEKKEVMWSLQQNEHAIHWLTPGRYVILVTDSLEEPKLHDIILLNVEATRHYVMEIAIGKKNASNIFSYVPSKVFSIVTKVGSTLTLVALSVVSGAPGSVLLPPIFPSFRKDDEQFHTDIKVK